MARAGSLFGVAVSPLATAANAAALGSRVKPIALGALASARQYADLLRERLGSLGVAPEAADRLKTAEASVALLDRLAAVDAKGVVGVLSEAKIPTTDAALGECVKGAGGWAGHLQDRVWNLVHQVTQGAPEIAARAAPVLDDLRATLSKDAHVTGTPLKTVLDTAYDRLLGVLLPPPVPSPRVYEPPTPQLPPPSVTPPPVTPSSPPFQKIPAKGEERVADAGQAQQRIDQIRAAHPGATIEVTIRWSEGKGR